MLFGLIQTNVYISASVDDITNYISSADNRLGEMSHMASESESHASAVRAVCEASLANAYQKLKLMSADLKRCNDNLKHNRDLLNEYKRRLSIAEHEKSDAWDAQVSAGEAYQRACDAVDRARSNAKDGDSGAISAAQSAADSAYRNYQNAKRRYDDACREVNRIKDMIRRLEDAILRLEWIQRDLEDAVRKTEDYISRVERDLEVLERTQREFHSAIEKYSATLKDCGKQATEAKSHFKDAVEHLCEASDIGYSGSQRLSVNGSECIKKAAGEFDLECEGKTAACKQLGIESNVYGGEMQDQISDAARAKAEEIYGNVQRYVDELRYISDNMHKASDSLKRYLIYTDVTFW